MVGKPVRKRIAANGHPLATKGTQIYEHRAVLYEKIGHGSHPCHWCGLVVDWTNEGLVAGALVVDHLDNNPLNNATDNLVPSCAKCNAGRADKPHMVKDDELFVMRTHQRLRVVELTCAHCGKTFVAPPSLVAAGKGKYCSHACTGKAAPKRRKLSDEDIIAIRAGVASGRSSKEIAEVFGIDSSFVWKIANLRRYAHVHHGGPTP